MIKKHLEAGKSITPLDALIQFGCLRLSGRIYDLRHNEKLPIQMELIEQNGHRFAKYSLKTEKTC